MNELLPMMQVGGQPAWENPQFHSLNKLPPHAAFFPYASAEAALGMAWTESPWVRKLSGAWDFKILSRPEEATQSVLESGGWSSIQVPGNWTMQGFGKPHYTNVQMPFPNTPPDVPDDNPTGVYRRGFGLPADWAGRRLVLHFAGCEGALFVYVNGRPVGMSKDARTPAEFDITALVKDGAENELVCVVTRWSDATYIEDQDHWWQSGLQRDVYLYATPLPFIQDIYAASELSADFKEAELAVKVQVGYVGEEYSADYRVEVQLFDSAGQAVFAQPLSAPCMPEVTHWHGAYPRTQLILKGMVAKPLLWSHEEPNLYSVAVTLRGPQTEEHTAVRFGFRKIEIRERMLLINGKRVRINGVNYHDHHDIAGKYMSPETFETDLKLMKQFNVNAVRTSHYPKDSYWYDLCDRYGMYLVDEANIESHAFYMDSCRDPRYTNAFVERVRAMVERDKNHPSVIFWSLGNESGYGPNHDAAAAYARRVDPTRPLHYEGAITKWGADGWHAGEHASDVVCPMYPQIQEIIDWSVEGKGWRPLIMCEYSHTMGNSNGSLSDYFAAFDKYPGLQGGYLWEWLDHGIRQTGADGKTYWAYGGDFGDTPNDANFVTDGIIWPDRTPHPALYEFKYLAAPVKVEAVDIEQGRVRLTNRRYFTSLDGGPNGLHGEWELVVDGEPRQKGKLPALKIGPEESLEVELGIEPVESGEAFLNFYFYQRKDTYWAPAEHEVAWEQLALPVKAVESASEAAGKVEMAMNGTEICLSAGAVKAVFNTSDGRLTWYGTDANMLAAAPQLNVWRAGTDNDGIKLMLGPGKALHRWLEQKLDQVEQRLAGIRIVEGELPAVEVVHNASGRGQWEDFTHTQRFTLLPSGELKVENQVKLGNELSDIPRVGVSLQLRSEMEDLAWYGRGPWENYSDRKASALVGLYGGTVSEQFVPYIMPQENGHKTDVRWLRLSGTDKAGRRLGLLVKSSRPLEFTASHYTANDLYACNHTHELQPRAEVVLELDAAMRGLGTASCGPDTLPQYRLLEQDYQFDYTLKAA